MVVGALLDEVTHLHPGLRPILRSSRVLVNGDPVNPATTAIHPGDELAVHPPYSGG
jgi:molybdopterin converting factor small subunit